MTLSYYFQLRQLLFYEFDFVYENLFFYHPPLGCMHHPDLVILAFFHLFKLFCTAPIVFTVQDDFERVENERDREVFSVMTQVIVTSNNA